MRRVVAALAAVAGTLLSVPAQAQILIGQTADFSGPAAGSVKEITDGAKLYLDSVNAKGGVNGQTIELIAMDDRFDAKVTAANAKALITEKNVVALFLSRGTPHTQAILPLLAKHGVPLIAPSTGAITLHKPVNPWVFNVRAPYLREAERAVQHLLLIGLERIGVVGSTDSGGAEFIDGALKGFAAGGKNPAFVEKYVVESADVARIGQVVVSSAAQAVVFAGPGKIVADGIDAIRKAGSHAQIVVFSNNATTGFVKLLKNNARGTIVTQVFPSERALAVPIVKEARDLAVAKGMTGISPAMLEGFAGAKVLVAGLKMAGPNPTRLKLQQALDSLQRLDIGGMEMGYSPNDHTGLEFVDLSIISADGTFRR